MGQGRWLLPASRLTIVLVREDIHQIEIPLRCASADFRLAFGMGILGLHVHRPSAVLIRSLMLTVVFGKLFNTRFRATDFDFWDKNFGRLETLLESAA